MIKKNDGILLSPEQEQIKKIKAEEDRQKKEIEFRTKKESLMKELGVIEVATIKFDPLQGITPGSVVLPYEWQKGETFLRVNQTKNNEKDNPKIK